MKQMQKKISPLYTAFYLFFIYRMAAHGIRYIKVYKTNTNCSDSQTNI